MNFFERILNEIPYLNSPFGIKLIKSAFIIAILLLLRLIIRHLILKKIKDVRIHYQWRKIVNSVLLIIGIIIVGRLWYDGVQSLATYLGLLSAGIAVALKDPLVNLAGWIYIISRKPFEVGDRIQLGDVAGDVIDQSAFEISLLEIGNWVHADQSTGRIITVPNGKIFTNYLANYDKGFKFVWNEIRVLITFESDWQKAKKILTAIAVKHSEHITTSIERQIKRAARKFMIYYQHLTPIVYTDVLDSGVQLTVRHLSETRERRKYTEVIWEEILKEFAENDDIDLAYPTTRFYKLGEK